jgi:hypothetical protein
MGRVARDVWRQPSDPSRTHPTRQREATSRAGTSRWTRALTIVRSHSSARRSPPCVPGPDTISSSHSSTSRSTHSRSQLEWLADARGSPWGRGTAARRAAARTSAWGIVDGRERRRSTALPQRRGHACPSAAIHFCGRPWRPAHQDREGQPHGPNVAGVPPHPLAPRSPRKASPMADEGQEVRRRRSDARTGG